MPATGIFAEDDYFVPGLCSRGCGLPVAQGRDRHGRAYVTCCRGCALGQGHDWRCQRAADNVQEHLLRSPKVAEEVKRAGPSGLAEPAVQQAILQAARAQAPEVAAQAAAQLRTWVQDPVVQAKARFYAGMAIQYSGRAGEAIISCIEQGPEGVRFMAFVVGCASLALAVFDAINPFLVLGHLFTYLLSLYQVLFSLATMVFEADPQMIAKWPPLSRSQDLLILNMRFLSLSLGRGLFYMYQGIVWIVVSSFGDFVHEALGLALCGVGSLYVLMHFEVMPQTLATKMRGLAEGRSGDGDYVRVSA